ncbi:hypothetical protein AK812_SmicGene42869, partial [Symbiodinium microadriaticum]
MLEKSKAVRLHRASHQLYSLKHCSSRVRTHVEICIIALPITKPFFHNSKQSAQCSFAVTAAWADEGSSAGVPALGGADADSAGTRSNATSSTSCCTCLSSAEKQLTDDAADAAALL